MVSKRVSHGENLIQCDGEKIVKVHIFWEGHKILRTSTLLLSYIVPVKSNMEILQHFVAFSEYMNFNMGTAQ